jgi:aspartyl aminopeptidase
VNKDGFKPNLETHLIPLLSTKIEETLESKEKSTASSLKPAHHPLLMQVSHSVFLQ